MIADQYIIPVLIKSTTLNVLKSASHGLDHWYRVWKNAQILVQTTEDVDMEIVALFALFHDAMRDNDYEDPAHGHRGLMLWRSMDQGRAPHILNAQQNYQMDTACTQHTIRPVNRDPTIGVCWDADRLDLSRFGIFPSVAQMSTEAGQQWAKHAAQ